MKTMIQTIAVTTSLCMLNAPLYAIWSINHPVEGSCYGQNSVVSGSGPGDAGDAGEVGEFSFGKGGGNPTAPYSAQSTCNVTGVEYMPGMVQWQTVTGQLAPPTNGWELSALEGMGFVKKDYSARLLESHDTTTPTWTILHKVI